MLLLHVMRRDHRWLLLMCLEGCYCIVRKCPLMRMCRCLMDLEGIREELGGPTTGCYCCCGQGLLILPGMNGQLGAVLLEHLGIDVKTKIDPE